MTWIYKNYKILLADKPDFVRGISKLAVSVAKLTTDRKTKII